uniref:QKR58E-2 n=1 Tax=Drosophila melanogaster TaxID=7227 RepID=O44432_DROME|nr:QKR58E-2 [Drosophila melanogaster]
MAENGLRVPGSSAVASAVASTATGVVRWISSGNCGGRDRSGAHRRQAGRATGSMRTNTTPMQTARRPSRAGRPEVHAGAHDGRSRMENALPLAVKLIDEALERVQLNGRIPTRDQYADVYQQRTIKLSQKVHVPIKDKKFNYVGKLLGRKGNSLRRLQEETQCKIVILGRFSMKDRAREEELRNSADAKYAHLNLPLHVEVSTIAPPAEATARVAYALAEIRRYLTPDKHDDIRQEQYRELMEDPEAAKKLSVRQLQQQSNAAASGAGGGGGGGGGNGNGGQLDPAAIMAMGTSLRRQLQTKVSATITLSPQRGDCLFSLTQQCVPPAKTLCASRNGQCHAHHLATASNCASLTARNGRQCGQLQWPKCRTG